ncbi:DUF2478 domain-containing protein [Mesorhizobium sp. 2RAF21]|uniref:DUF2478 domain-containing protein n=1 Tax=Mesorhizobium sp. 2RAF21 TaxID=3232995 RepID=UPI003F9A7421
MTRQGSIAVVSNTQGTDTQSLLAGAAARWHEKGVKVVGVLAEDGDVPGKCSAGFLRDIASGRRYVIALEAPPTGTTCHLDASGVKNACAGVIDDIEHADLVLLSKFGKLEAMREGLWPVFSVAVEAGKPLLTTVSARHFDAWKAFAPETLWLEPNGQSIAAWWQAATAHHSKRL